jgi:hypothetical protein
MPKADWVSKKKGSRHYAIRLAQLARQQGKLIPSPTCQFCGELKTVDGHHEDYAKPLEVIWLCEKCHRVFDEFGGVIHGFFQHLTEVLHISLGAAVLSVGNPQVRTFLSTLPETAEMLALIREAAGSL